MKNIILACLVFAAGCCTAQPVEDESALDDSNLRWGHDFFSLTFGGENTSYHRYPDPVFFQFRSSTPNFIIQKSMPLPDLSILSKLYVSMDLSLENRLCFNANMSLCAWSSHASASSMAGGMGYVFSLSPKEQFLLRPYLNAVYSFYSYDLGSNYQSGEGIMLNGRNIGNTISAITYENRNFALLPGADLIIQGRRFGFVAGLGYSIPIHSSEYIEFSTSKTKSYKANCSSNDFIYDYSGHILHGKVVESTRFIQVKLGVSVMIRTS